MSKECRYTKDHEWACIEGAEVRIGITDYAQSELGDVVFVDLPQVGRETKRGEGFATVESVKAVSEVYAPLSGQITAVNAELSAQPELVNRDPQGEGWFSLLKPSDPKEFENLMSEADYKAYIAQIAK